MGGFWDLLGKIGEKIDLDEVIEKGKEAGKEIAEIGKEAGKEVGKEIVEIGKEAGREVGKEFLVEAGREFIEGFFKKEMTFEEKLEVLEKLYRDGKITEEEFRLARRYLLEKFANS